MGRKGQFGVGGEGQEMKVKKWMTPDPKSVEANDPVKTAVNLVIENRIRHLPVVLGDSLVGIISDRDLKRAMPSIVAGATAEEYQAFMEETSVEQVMTADPLTCAPDDELVDLVRQFCEKKVGAIPVVEGERLVGIVTQTDMMEAFLTMLENQ
jgi:acetoin utilization protein AcuB